MWISIICILLSQKKKFISILLYIFRPNQEKKISSPYKDIEVLKPTWNHPLLCLKKKKKQKQKKKKKKKKKPNNYSYMVFASISLKILYIKNKLFYNKYIDTKYFYPFFDGWCCLWLNGDSCMIEVACPYKKKILF